MNENKIFFDLTSLVDREGDNTDSSHSSFLSEGSDVNGNNGPRNELSYLLMENDWEDALSMIVDALNNSVDVNNIACDAEKSGKEQGYLPVHYACREGAPPNIIQELLKLHPESVSARTGESGWILLHFVAAGKIQMGQYYHEHDETDGGSSCRSECMLCKDTSHRVAAARILLAASPACILTTDHDGMSPLHVACIEEAEPDLLNIILNAAPTVAELTDDDGNLPLHWIFHKHISVDSAQNILHAYPDGARTVNMNGTIPLYKACAVGAPVEVIRLLLSQYPDGATKRDNHGNLPLHLIIPKRPGEGVKQKERVRDIEVRANSVRALLDIYPEGAGVRNNHGETSLMRALSEEVPLEIVQLLIDADTDCCSDMISKEGVSSGLSSLFVLVE